MNKLIEIQSENYLKNRDRYLRDGRAAEGNAAQQAARNEAKLEKMDELRGKGLSKDEVEKQANEWMKKQNALHSPDQIAGGNPNNITGMGDARINSSIGAQWKKKIKDVDEHISNIAKTMTEEEKKNTYLNINLSR